MQEAFDWNEEPPFDPAIEYQGLLRGLRRKKGFGLYFVQCSPAGGMQLIERIRQDLPQKIEVLKFDAAMDGNFYQCVADYLRAHRETEVLFVQGLEYSLLSYEATKREEGWSSEETHSYSWKAVPRLLGNLNLQRERFRDDFPIRFVFLLPLFAMKYLIRRAPDFFDWRSGLYEFPIDSDLMEQESLQIVQEADYNEYLNWTQLERNRKIAEIQCWISEPNQTSERKPQLLLEQGHLFYTSNEYEAAVASYDQVLKYKPNDHEVWFMRGIALSKLQCYEEVISSYDQALKHKPDDDAAWYFRGIALDELGRYEEAVASYDQALKYKPDDHGVWFMRGIALSRLQRYEEAISSYDQALQHKPDKDAAWYNRGIALDELGRYEEAITSYDQALQHKPDKDAAWHNRGIALAHLQRYEEATTSFYYALKIEPNDHEVWCDYGLALAYLQRYEEAITNFDYALKIRPDDARTFYNKACCYEWQGQVELAIATLKQAIDLDPKYREMAKTDADFDRVRSDDRFQALLKD
jgi:tetratricopeptide (TPR) repeat protein